MRTHTRSTVVVAVLSAAALLASGCATSDPGTPPDGKNPSDLERNVLTIGYNVPYDPTFVPDLAAFACLEERHGVTANVKEVKGAPASIASLIAGALDITLSTLGAGLNAIVEGQDIVAVVPSASAPYFTLMAPSDVKDWSDLKGLTFGSTSPSDSSYYTTALLLEANGLSADDVQWVTVQGSAARAQAMVAGKIDAGQVTVMEMLQVESESDKRAFATVGEFFPDLIFNAYWVDRSFLEANPKLVGAFVECLMDEHAAAQNESVYLEKASDLLPEGLDDAALRRAYKTLMGMQIWDPEESSWNEESGNATVETMAKFGAIGEFVPFEEWADDSIVSAVRDSRGN